MTYVRSRRSPRMPDSGVARAWTRPRTKVMSPRVEGAAFQAAPTKEKEAGRMASSAFSTTYARLATPVVRRRAARARGVSAAWTASWVASNAGAARGVAMDSGFLRAVAVAVAACQRGGGRGRRGGGEGGGIRAGRVRACVLCGGTGTKRGTGVRGTGRRRGDAGASGIRRGRGCAPTRLERPAPLPPSEHAPLAGHVMPCSSGLGGSRRLERPTQGGGTRRGDATRPPPPRQAVGASARSPLSRFPRPPAPPPRPCPQLRAWCAACTRTWPSTAGVEGGRSTGAMVGKKKGRRKDGREEGGEARPLFSPECEHGPRRRG